MHRRSFLQMLAAAGAGPMLGGNRRPSAVGGEPIDRRALVDRHAPVVRAVDPFSVLSVGNGGFAFTADVTGLQTFPDAYREIPLATQSEWGWHSFPNPERYTLADATTHHETPDGSIPYADQQTSAAGQWLRQNPHRLSLATIGLVLSGEATDLTDLEQRLDLWNGLLTSRFRYRGQLLIVQTCVHPSMDVVVFRIAAGSPGTDLPALRIAFPYGAPVHTGDPADWSHPDRHQSALTQRSAVEAAWDRSLDADRYAVRACWSDGGHLRPHAAHEFRLTPEPGTRQFELVVAFSPDALTGRLPSFAEVRTTAGTNWQRFWSDGAAVDLSGSSDPRAQELERRIVLSQYLTAIQCAGTLPPQETGLTFNSWHGKSHLEMHWWHAVHFALWDRLPLLERSLRWYRDVLPRAQETARIQGYTGARWPKMVGPDGRESPSTIGVFLIWQQPHPIYYAELLYRAYPERAVLETYRELVFETASFMASFARWDDVGARHVLGPPLIPAQELHPPDSTLNPTFELAYWRWGLETAQRWRERLGLGREPSWQRVLDHLAPLPMRDGVYVNAESDPHTFSDVAKRRDHPTLLGAYGFVPPDRVDRAAMRRTLDLVLRTWEWEETWGWDYPLVAMTAARLGEPEKAVDALLMDTPKNRYLPNGHNHQREGLTIYLPGNGGLLVAVAMMAGGWDGSPAGTAPGFPRAGWQVRSERLRKLP